MDHIGQLWTSLINKVSQAGNYKYQNDSKVEFTGYPSETESDSDSAEGTEGEGEVSASSVKNKKK